MSELALVSLVLGGILLVLYGWMLLRPAACLKAMKAFPRNRPAGIFLTAVDLVWAGHLLYESPLGFLEEYKGALFLLTPLAIILVVIFVDELLAPRALGGLFILVPHIMLDAARWYDSPLRFVVTVLGYVMVIKGVVLVVSPYYVRKGLERFCPDTPSLRRWASVGCAIGGLLVVLGLFVY